jgi:hypothetical protein
MSVHYHGTDIMLGSKNSTHTIHRCPIFFGWAEPLSMDSRELLFAAIPFSVITGTLSSVAIWTRFTWICFHLPYNTKYSCEVIALLLIRTTTTFHLNCFTPQCKNYKQFLVFIKYINACIHVQHQACQAMKQKCCGWDEWKQMFSNTLRLIEDEWWKPWNWKEQPVGHYTCYEAVHNRLSTTVRFDNQETNNDRKTFKHIMNKLAQCVQFIGS